MLKKAEYESFVKLLRLAKVILSEERTWHDGYSWCLGYLAYSYLWG
jgi:hypothetical protein